MMLESDSQAEQLELRRHLPAETFYQDIAQVYLNNPFFHLTDEELELFRSAPNASPLRRLIVTREAAARSAAPKYAVFCMPKSGSTFVKSALQHALELPFVSMTSFTTPRLTSLFGGNSREQELDELGLAKSILSSPRGFVAQHHTRYSTFLARQMKFFKIQPIVTIRNVLDSIVSFDEMMTAWRQTPGESWISDAQFPLPLDYPSLPATQRYTILARSFGVWLIGFFLSWKRAAQQGLVDPVVLHYETHVVQPEALAEALLERVPMTDEQAERLRRYVINPDRERVRLNVGVAGRGAALLPSELQAFLADYAATFRDEITPEEIRKLVA